MKNKYRLTWRVSDLPFLYGVVYISLCEGIFKQSMGLGASRNREGIGLSYRPARDRIFKRVWGPGIGSNFQGMNSASL